MKKPCFLILALAFSLIVFDSYSQVNAEQTINQADSISITPGDTTEYEILIVEIGYDTWMLTQAKPKWFYSNDYYRNKNQFLVVNWNNRVIETMHDPPYENLINYDPNIDYGLDVNYKLYWYFKFIQHKYGTKPENTIR